MTSATSNSRFLISALLVLGALTSVSGQARAQADCRVDKSKYDRLAENMPYASAISVLGCPGEEVSRTEVPGASLVMYSWPGGSFGIGSTMAALFENGRLAFKSQLGLD